MKKWLLILAVALAFAASGVAVQPVAAKKPCDVAAACQQCKAGGDRNCGAEGKCVEAGARCGASTDGKCVYGADCERVRCGAAKGARCSSAGDGKCSPCKTEQGS